MTYSVVLNHSPLVQFSGVAVKLGDGSPCVENGHRAAACNVGLQRTRLDRACDFG